MPVLSSPIMPSLPRLTPVAIIDILIVAFLIYQFLMAVRGRRAAHILAGLLLIFGVYELVNVLGLELMRSAMTIGAPFVPLAVIVLFQSELRRLLARIGGLRWLSVGGRLQKREFTEELVMAFTQLQQQKVGALVVVERDIGLRSFVESGVLMDAFLSRDLLLTIFHPGSALHDGAVIVQGEKIAAAACFLPLTVRPALARHLGTRHRAAIGVTEETDCLALIVSEETGRISVAVGGEIEIGVTAERFEQRITEHLIRRTKGSDVRGRSQKWREEQHLEREAARDARAD
ncbi:MAG: TIGR00159 family protein [Bryobacteraceae bacterium]|nr:TIGR00159 family protein [Bryobacteraceae bacterium]